MHNAILQKLKFEIKKNQRWVGSFGGGFLLEVSFEIWYNNEGGSPRKENSTCLAVLRGIATNIKQTNKANYIF